MTCATCGAVDSRLMSDDHATDCSAGLVFPQRKVVLLQNAWGNCGTLSSIPREWWLQGLQRSRTGKRLRILLGNNDYTCCWNTTDVVTRRPDGRAPPDPGYVSRILLEQRPDLLVACGTQAEEVARRFWRGPLLCVPHPACRVLTTELYRRASAMLKHGIQHRVALRQRRGHVQLVRFVDKVTT